VRLGKRDRLGCFTCMNPTFFQRKIPTFHLLLVGLMNAGGLGWGTRDS
jgi:hypothetical protein